VKEGRNDLTSTTSKLATRMSLEPENSNASVCSGREPSYHTAKVAFETQEATTNSLRYLGPKIELAFEESHS